jgi:glutathione S-transferase
MEKYAPFFEKALKEAGSGFYAKSGPTYFDFHAAEAWERMQNLDPDVMAKYPFFAAHTKRVHELPKIKEYVAKRPPSNM